MKRIAAMMAALCVSCLYGEEAAADAAPAGERSATLMGRKVTIERDGSDFADIIGEGSRKAKESKKANLLIAHDPSDVFLQMNGETLTWGKIDEYSDLVLKISPLTLPPQATVEQINQVIAMSRKKLAELAGNELIKNWVLVPRAKEAGIVVSDAEILQAISNSVRKIKKEFKNEALKISLDPESYLYRKQVGYLYSKKYAEMLNSKEIEVSEDDVAAAIAERSAEIAKAREYNATLRPKIEGILEDIKSGKIEFADAALEYSDCGSSVDEGVWGEFYADRCKLLQPLKDFVFAASTNVLSDVIETPFSYHIVKILDRGYESRPDDEDDDDDDDGEGEE